MTVTAPAEAALRIATTVGERVSILVGRRKWVAEMHENVRRYGCEHHLASFRVLGMAVDEFQREPARTEERIFEEARRAVEDDGAAPQVDELAAWVPICEPVVDHDPRKDD